ncbi:hypothetical protein pb186bvf_013115 [Paramecium bursaria]
MNDFIVLDKPIYRPRQVQRYHSVLLNESSNQLQRFKLSEFIEELVKQIQEGYKLDSIQQQNIIYQGLLKLGQATFSRDYQLQLQLNKVSRESCLRFYLKIRKFFKSHKNEELFKLIEQLETEQTEESDSEQEIKAQDKKSQKQIVINSDGIIQLQSQLQQKEKQIQELQQRIKYKEDAIKDITTGYSKDVQHMKELLYRKDNNKQDIFEVQYFDETDGLDQEQIQMLNKKLEILKAQAEIKIERIMQSFLKLHGEYEQQTIYYQSLQQKMKNMDKPEELLSRVIQLHNNPYKTWRLIQDIKGNEYFFNVFENQKFNYGIDYREIDKLLINSKAQQREVQYQVKLLNEQLGVFMDSQITHLNQLREENYQLQQQIIQLKQKQTQLNSEVIDYMKTHVEQLAHRRYEQKLNEIFKDNITLSELQEQFENFKIQQAFKRWLLIGRLLKVLRHHKDFPLLLRELRMAMIDDHAYRQLQQNNHNQQIYYKSIIDELIQKYEREKIETIFNQYMVSKYEKQEQIIMNLVSQKEQDIIELRQQFMQLQSKNQTISHHLIQLVKVLDSRIAQLPVEEIDITDNKKESSKHLQKVIKSLDQNKQEQTKLLKDQFKGNQNKLDQFLRHIASRSKECQTDIQGIKFKITLQFENYHLVEQWIKQQMGINNQSVGTVTTEFINQDQRDKSQQYTILTENMLVTQNFNSIENHIPSSAFQRTSMMPSVISEHEPQIQQIETKVEIQVEPQQPRISLIHMEKNEIDSIFKESRLLEAPKNIRQTSQEIPNISCTGRQIIQRDSVKKDVTDFTHHTKANNDSIYDRLYKDSLDKRERLEVLKQHIDTLDQFKWEQIVQIIQSCQEKVTEGRQAISSRSGRAIHFYKSKSKRPQTQEKLEKQEKLQLNASHSDANKTVYVENMLDKFKSKTRRMQGYLDKPIKSQWSNQKDKFDFSQTFILFKQ